MTFCWHNRFNGLEHDGPFSTLEMAKASAVDAYVQIQGGFAFDVVIKNGSKIVAEGHIKKGVWRDGEFKETAKESVARLAENG